MHKTTIEWVRGPNGEPGYVYNPVWGCMYTCPYCYARGIARRFAGVIERKEMQYHFKHHPTWAWTGDHLSGLRDFKPTWLESNFNTEFPKEPSRIFVNSMSDIAFWDPEWRRRVTNQIEHYKQHNFIFLTKNPWSLCDWDFPWNCQAGVTAVNLKTVLAAMYVFEQAREELPSMLFLSIEPMQERIPASFIDENIVDWIIVGAETGNRKGKIIPQREWIEELVSTGIPVFMKENIRSVWGDELIQQYPEEERG